MMKMEEKLQNAILSTLQFKGISVHLPEATKYVDLYNDKCEIGIRPEAFDVDVFMWTFYEMLRKGEVKLDFRFDNMEKRKDGTYKYYDYLMRLNIEEELIK